MKSVRRRARISANRSAKVVMPAAASHATSFASDQPSSACAGCGASMRLASIRARRVLPLAQAPIVRDLALESG
ncbi:hypothetical protein WT02_18145 [Burkholderia stagnalis]|nr:hypothetical protein WT02_18145 [Burkholderia stagnalis]KVM13120.1 hypothetical protein WT04_11465 [Burkholderia stagnalis]